MMPLSQGGLGEIEYLQTQPKNTQYKAATIGRGIEAKSAPNFPGQEHDYPHLN